MKHQEFMDKTNDPESLPCRMIVSLYGQEIVNEIRAEIQKIGVDGA
jgi:hypothetical protein